MSKNQYKPAENSIKNRTRKGRGNASGKGGECGRGHKGQKSRSGYSSKPGFEGGQMPLYKRIPKNRGFKNNFKRVYFVINLNRLSEISEDNEKLTPEVFYNKGLVKKGIAIKVLGSGEISKKNLNIEMHAFSKQALEKLKKAGATCGIIK